ncbi:magnesium transporter MgtC [Burkholderia ubonensis]|uniref:Protein MgtC n=1 Tax=Burkholderia ubonensis TaxID=101571 RepID=A0A106QCI8_9BURK|nr:MgtC/SapB family protein [Burkholderia ubonensis]KWA83722.1 magnesium transporter MgtC [Burkholderia ubonensis]
MLDLAYLEGYWQGMPLQANLIIALNLLGSLLLGMLVGYERAYHGRAAGMRTYGLVCMASCALTVFVGYSSEWFGGAGSPVHPDPTRVVQGIVSGIGFLCAGVIMKDGLSINGLTTAASLWAASAIGIMVGVGFYAAAVTMAGLALLSMTTGRVIQDLLPSKESLGVMLQFKPGPSPVEAAVVARALEKGYVAQMSRLSISSEDGKMVWRFPLEAASGSVKGNRAELARELAALPYLHSFSLEPARH